MAEIERRAAAVPATQHSQADIESLPALFGRLGDDVVELLDTKLTLLRVELKEDVSVYGRAGTLLGIGAAIATVGFALVNVAIAFFISMLFGNDDSTAVVQRYGPGSYGLGFLITGLVYLVIGGIIAYVGKNRLAARSSAPNRSLDELRKDKQWLKNEM